ncbi:MAG TPA: 2'-5' RNA ligase family protein [Gaiellaceae bacterium]|nr:2'-5' RNA ligase family protein [Gaiellaceae bacterium]
MPRRTALVVAVPGAAPYYQPGNGMPAHVTVLFPFLPPDELDEEALAALLARFPGFDVVFDRLERFDDGTPWLRPAPSAPFVDLTAAVWQRWPDSPPYEGAFDEVIPHLTVTRTDVPLPIAAHVGEVLLLEEGDDSLWETRRSFALAQRVA